MPEYVWITQDYTHLLYPSVTRYTLLKKSSTGVTVSMRGTPHPIRKASGRKFFTDEARLQEYLKRCVASALETAKRRVAALQALTDGTETIPIETVPDQPINHSGKLKL